MIACTMISLSPCVGEYTTQKSKTSQPKKKIKKNLVFYNPAGNERNNGGGKARKEGNAGNITKSGKLILRLIYLFS